MDIDTILLEAEEHMEKGLNYLKNELRGVRTGRASPALIEFIKVDYYGSPTDLRSIALVTTPEPTQLLIKPFDATSVQAIVKAIQTAGIGLNPISEGKQIRVSIPPLSGDRRTQFINSVKKTGEEAKVTVRNARRDANKHIETAGKDKSSGISEDQVEKAKEEIQALLKKYEATVDELVAAKVKEIQQI